MTGNSSALSLSRYPDPACSYDFVDGTPVLRDTNDAFDARFGSEPADTTLAEAFDRLGLQTANSTDLDGCLRRDEPFRVRAVDTSDGPAQSEDGVEATDAGRAGEVELTDGTRETTGEYLVEPVPPGEEVGFLLFVARPEEDISGHRELGIDHVASVVSHDLRNPLDVARARLDAGRALDEEEHFDHVEQAHERMERIIQDVLTIARGEEVVDPDDTVDLTDVAETAWETVETNGARLDIEEQLPTATADPGRVRRLFENLFRNSVEHGSAGADGVTVTVGRLDGTDDGFYVADDGPGIPAPHRERAFEPGFSTDDHGTGLGLAIVARIADLHGWSIAATAAETGGARLEVSGVG
jgi:signal transduction histidine kinase